MIRFRKMHAQGNDFVILGDGRVPAPPVNTELVRAICARRFGVGCDQLLVLDPDPECDARMRIFNADGSEACQCGNGVRCAGRLLMDLRRTSSVRLRLADRVVTCEEGAHGVRASLGPVAIEQAGEDFVDLSLGNPHRVWFATPPEDELHNPARNMEIVGGETESDIWVEVFERGVGRTLACGSGAAATAAAVWARRGAPAPVAVHMPGGVIHVEGDPENIVIEAPAFLVFTGELDPDAIVRAQPPEKHA